MYLFGICLLSDLVVCTFYDNHENNYFEVVNITLLNYCILNEPLESNIAKSVSHGCHHVSIISTHESSYIEVEDLHHKIIVKKNVMSLHIKMIDHIATCLM